MVISYPPAPVRRQPATRNDAVEMGVMGEVLSPGVKHREEPDLSTESWGSAAMVRSVSAVARNRMS